MNPPSYYINHADEVVKQRGQEHGNYVECFNAISTMWTAYFEAKGWTIPVSSDDVAKMMVLMKICRAAAGHANREDHYVDMIGYAAIAGALISRED